MDNTGLQDVQNPVDGRPRQENQGLTDGHPRQDARDAEAQQKLQHRTDLTSSLTETTAELARVRALAVAWAASASGYLTIGTAVGLVGVSASLEYLLKLHYAGLIRLVVILAFLAYAYAVVLAQQAAQGPLVKDYTVPEVVIRNQQAAMNTALAKMHASQRIVAGVAVLVALMALSALFKPAPTPPVYIGTLLNGTAQTVSCGAVIKSTNTAGGLTFEGQAAQQLVSSGGGPLLVAVPSCPE